MNNAKIEFCAKYSAILCLCVVIVCEPPLYLCDSVRSTTHNHSTPLIDTVQNTALDLHCRLYHYS